MFDSLSTSACIPQAPVHTTEIPKEILHKKMITMPKGNLSNGPIALTLSCKRTLHRKVVALEMPTIPGSDDRLCSWELSGTRNKRAFE